MKKIAIYGDSISTGSHGGGGYEPLICDAFKPEQIYNFAVGSSGLVRSTPNSMISILENKEIPCDVDLFFIWHGSNDWYWGSDLKEFADAIEKAVLVLREAAPEAYLAWATPIYRFEKPDTGETKGKTIQTVEAGEAYRLKNSAGNTMMDYYLTLEKTSKELGFYLIDMRRLCQINRQNEAFYLEDRVHPNRAGYEKIAGILIAEFKRLVKS